MKRAQRVFLTVESQGRLPEKSEDKARVRKPSMFVLNGFPFKQSSEISARNCARPASRQSALPFAKETKLKQYMLIAICTAFG